MASSTTPASAPSQYSPFRSPALETVVWYLALVLTLVGLFVKPLRYAAYLVPALALMLGLAEGRFRAPAITLPYLLLLVVGLATLYMGNMDGAKDLAFIASGISMSLVLSRVAIPSWTLFSLFACCTVFNAALYGRLSGGVSFDVLHSESSFEGVFGFLFGLLCIFGAISGQKRLAMASFFASLMVLKRITIIAELTCLAVLLLPERARKVLLHPLVMIAGNVILVAILVLYALHTFDGIIAGLTGQSGNQLGMGRQALYEGIASEVARDPLRFLVLGDGPGAGYGSLGWTFEMEGLHNLHSDLLKVFYEYGLLVLALFLYLGYSARNTGVRVLFLYANILYVTDNTLIYHFFGFFLCAFGLAIELAGEPGRKGEAHED